MKRRNFFKLATTGAAGITWLGSCTNSGSNGVSSGGNTAQPGTIPAYRKSIVPAFASGTQKSANDRIVVALIGAGNHGITLILQVANLGENVFVKYLCDVDDTRLYSLPPRSTGMDWPPYGLARQARMCTWRKVFPTTSVRAKR